MDCLVIGAGPAGLTAATYLARFRRDFLVVDASDSRAAWIPVSHNVPSYPDGISGRELLARMRQQAERYGARFLEGEVTRLERSTGGGFLASVGERSFTAATVLLATGAVDRQPDVPHVDRAVLRTLVRHCPICDAFEVQGQKVAVVGYGRCSTRELTLLRGYTDDLTLLTMGCPLEMTEAERRELAAASVELVEEPIAGLEAHEHHIEAIGERTGRRFRFDTLYSALGHHPRTELALTLGAAHDADGALLVDDHQRTSVRGLYAAGDAVAGLDQIAVAMGQAAIAATTINNELPRRMVGADQG